MRGINEKKFESMEEARQTTLEVAQEENAKAYAVGKTTEIMLEY